MCVFAGGGGVMRVWMDRGEDRIGVNCEHMYNYLDDMLSDTNDNGIFDRDIIRVIRFKRDMTL